MDGRTHGCGSIELDLTSNVLIYLAMFWYVTFELMSLLLHDRHR